jgi:Ca-activated chloride channel family protein
VTIDWPAGSEAWPRRLPDLYAGEPVVAFASLPALEGEVVVRGRFAGERWSARLPITASGGHEGVHALWARAKIDALADAQVAGANPDDVRAEIIGIALAHHLVSRHTSLVAVDVTPTTPAGIDALSTPVAGNLPQGQEYEAIFGGLPRTATPAALHATLSVAATLAALLLLFARRRFATARRVRPRHAVDRPVPWAE